MVKPQASAKQWTDAALASVAASTAKRETDFQEAVQSPIGNPPRLRSPLHLHQIRLNPVMVLLLGDRRRHLGTLS